MIQTGAPTDETQRLRKEAAELNQGLGREKALLAKGKKKRKGSGQLKYEQMISELDDVIDSIKKYLHQGLGKTMAGRSILVGKGTSKERSGYNIKNGSYTDLQINIPLLENEMILESYRNGALVYQTKANKETIDLLTKR